MTPSPTGGAWRPLPAFDLERLRSARVRAFLETAYDASLALLVPRRA